MILVWQYWQWKSNNNIWRWTQFNKNISLRRNILTFTIFNVNQISTNMWNSQVYIQVWIDVYQFYDDNSSMSAEQWYVYITVVAVGVGVIVWTV